MTQLVPPLCVVGPLPPPAGGMANQCEQLVRLLRQDGVHVEFVRTNEPYRPAWLGRIPVLRAAARLPLYVWQLWRAAGRAEAMHVLANSGWSWHLFAAPAIVIGRLRGLRVIVNYRGGNAESFLAKSAKPVLMTLRMAHALVTPSSFLQRVFSGYGLTAQVVPNIVDLSRFRPSPARDFGMAPHLIVTRNLEPIYDIPTAIRAFALLRAEFPGARLTVAGSGPELPHLQALVAGLGLGDSVVFAGRIDNADIPALYAGADCVLNPSTVDNMPISILEAHASGVPVVSTNVGGIPDIVQDGVSALLVPAGDHEAMARAAIRVLADRPFAQRMRDAGLSSVSKYAWPVVREQWFRIYCAPDRMMENAAS